ncbi:solute carrier family 22 member 21-like [Mytilus trossulus]|uniref:solute carrier family 22 member 21-like n=1 Tax=Mytilus trossulus TaxID=6551 RepID=UPI0030079675
MSMSSVSEYLENTLEECGGLGRFQWLLIASIIGGKISITWTTLMMSFGGAIPDWSCQWGNETTILQNITIESKTCHPPQNYSDLECVRKVYDDSMHTVVNQWDLVCDRDWITQTFTTIQMGGLLVGGLIAGQVADIIGRKPAYFISMFFLFLFNLVAAFSSNWQMFAAFRFLIGLASGFYLSVFFVFVAEFMPRKYRSMIMAIPAWPIWAAAFGGVSYLIHDWKYLHIATAAVTAPFLFTWWFIPESFRWLVANDQIEKAEEVIRKIARINNAPVPDTSKLKMVVENSISHNNKKYTYLDIFRNPDFLKKTILLAVSWISFGYGYYAIAFGVQQLSGSLYLNMFLLSIVEVPSQVITYFLNNCMGRKWTTFMFLVLATVSGTVVGVVQMVDIPAKDGLINGFAMATKLFLAAGWCALMLLTTESFPTVVRNMGYGIQNSVTRVGSMVAPQIVYLSQHIDGLMYFLVGALMFLSAICLLGIPETRNKTLSDTIEDKKHKQYQEHKQEEKSKDLVLSER